MNPLLAGILAASSRVHRAIEFPLAEPAAEFAAIAALVPALLLVAFWNGFPLIYYDTGAYVLQGLGHHFLLERSPVYSLFLKFAGAGSSLWIVVILQAAATAYVVVLCARSIEPGLAFGSFAAICTALILFTGLPWYVGEVEPDCFAPLVVLATYLLTFRANGLGTARTAILLLLTGFAAASHTSHLLLAAGLWLVVAGSDVVRRSTRMFVDWPRPNLAKPAAAILFGALLVLGSNFFLTRQVFVSRAGPAFLFARLLQDHIVMRLLEDTCPQSAYRLCAYKDFLPPTANAWLWAPYSPFLKLGGFDGTRTESERIVRDSLERYPLLSVGTAIVDAMRQFLLFKTGDQIEPQQWAIRAAFSAYLPDQVAPYLTARQQQGSIKFPILNIVHVPFGYISLCALTGLLGISVWCSRRHDVTFLGVVFLGLAANAFICGALSNPHDRYQSRMMWLAPFAVALVVAGTRGRETIWGASGDSSESPCGSKSNPALIGTQLHSKASHTL